MRSVYEIHLMLHFRLKMEEFKIRLKSIGGKDYIFGFELASHGNI